jgi:hypothetical protein
METCIYLNQIKTMYVHGKKYKQNTTKQIKIKKIDLYLNISL